MAVLWATDRVGGFGVSPPFGLKVTVYCLGALQLAVVPRLIPEQVQVKFSVLESGVVGFPWVQSASEASVSVGGMRVGVLAAVQQLPLIGVAVLEAVQVSVVPGGVPPQVQVQVVGVDSVGNPEVSGEGVPWVQNVSDP